jgi:EamA-like transporter family
VTNPAASRPLDRGGLVLCLISAAGFGSLAIFGKQAYAGGLGVIGVLAMRFAVAAPLLIGLALVARRRLRLGWPVGLRLLALGGIGYAIQATLFFNALTRISAPGRPAATVPYRTVRYRTAPHRTAPHRTCTRPC